MRKFLVISVVLASFIILAALYACTGSSVSHEPAAKGSAPRAYEPPEDLERLQTGGAFSVHPTDERGNPRPDLAGNFEIKILERPDSTLVEVYAVNFIDADWVFFKLNYNPNMYKPKKVDFTEFMGTPNDVISIAITGYWRYVDVGMARIHFDTRPGVNGSGLICTATFANSPFGEKRYIARDSQNPNNFAPTGDVNRVALTVESVDGLPVLAWKEKNIGDGDNNGSVGVPDITPIALNYLATLPDAEKPYLEIVDYDANGVIGVADITPIAIHYLTNLSGYQVLTSPNGTTFTPVTTGATILRSEVNSAPATTDGRLQYSWSPATPPSADTYYRVAPVASNGDVGQISNTIFYQTAQPLQNIRIVDPTVGDSQFGIPADANALPLIITEKSLANPENAEPFARPQVQLRAIGLPIGAAEEMEVTDMVFWDIQMHDQVASVSTSGETKGLVTGMNRGAAIVRAISPLDFQVKATFEVSCATISELEMTSSGSTNPLSVAPGAEVPFAVTGSFWDGSANPPITGIDLTNFVGWLLVQNTTNSVNFVVRTDGTLLTSNPGIETGDWVRVFCQYPAADNPVLAFGFVATSNPIQVTFN